MRRILTIWLLALVLAGCGQKAGVHESVAEVPVRPGPTEPAFPGALPATDPQAAVLALCDAGTRAAAGDLAGTRSAFEDRAHAFLHEYAATLQTSDPGAAGRLLEAKEQVEAGLADGTPLPELASRIATLRGALEQAATASGTPVQGCF